MSISGQARSVEMRKAFHERSAELQIPRLPQDDKVEDGEFYWDP